MWKIQPSGAFRDVVWYVGIYLLNDTAVVIFNLLDDFVDNAKHENLSIPARGMQCRIGTINYTSFTRSHGTCPTLYMITLAPRNMQWPLAQCGSSCGDLSDILIFHLLIARDV
jgi:hypothetical protein